MKKRVLLAMLAMSVVLTATACGTKEEKTETKTETEETKTEETSEETEDENSGEIDPEETVKAEVKDYGNRLVSVDNVSKYITVGEYKGITLDKTVAEVTDTDIDVRIEQELSAKAEEVKDGELQNGDVATIDFTGLKDGVAFDGGTATNYDLEIGSGSFINGFEDGMLGMKKGETRELELTFPEEYPEASLAGQPVVFKVTLQSFKRAPELTDEWVAANTESKDVEAYRTAIKEELQEQAQITAEEGLKDTAWQTVWNNAEVTEYPEEDLQNAYNEMENYMREQLTTFMAQSGMEKEEFLESQQMTEEDFESYIKEQSNQYAELKVKQNLIVQMMMDTEGIDLDNEVFEGLKEEMVSTYGAGDFDTLVGAFGKANVNDSLGLLWAEKFIVENATIQDKISEADTVGIDGEAVEEGEEAVEELSEEEIEEIAEEEAAE